MVINVMAQFHPPVEVAVAVPALVEDRALQQVRSHLLDDPAEIKSSCVAAVPIIFPQAGVLAD